MNLPVLNQYDPENARTLCDFAALSYGKVIEGGLVAEKTDTHVSISVLGPDVIVAFRGTADVRNWLTDLDCSSFELDNCRIHRGFALALNSVIAKLTDEIMRLQPARVWLTGHSLGGALAMLYAWRWQTNYHEVPFAGVYTFGQPRVGNGAFRDLYGWSGLKARTFRLIHANDLIPRVPWLLGKYRHAGHEVFYTGEPGKYIVDAPTLTKLPCDLRNAWRELRYGHVALLADHHVRTYQDLFGNSSNEPGLTGSPRCSGADAQTRAVESDGERKALKNGKPEIAEQEVLGDGGTSCTAKVGLRNL